MSFNNKNFHLEHTDKQIADIVIKGYNARMQRISTFNKNALTEAKTSINKAMLSLSGERTDPKKQSPLSVLIQLSGGFRRKEIKWVDFITDLRQTVIDINNRPIKDASGNNIPEAIIRKRLETKEYLEDIIHAWEEMINFTIFDVPFDWSEDMILKRLSSIKEWITRQKVYIGTNATKIGADEAKRILDRMQEWENNITKKSEYIINALRLTKNSKENIKGKIGKIGKDGRPVYGDNKVFSFNILDLRNVMDGSPTWFFNSSTGGEQSYESTSLLNRLFGPSHTFTRDDRGGFKVYDNMTKHRGGTIKGLNLVSLGLYMLKSALSYKLYNKSNNISLDKRDLSENGTFSKSLSDLAISLDAYLKSKALDKYDKNRDKRERIGLDSNNYSIVFNSSEAKSPQERQYVVNKAADSNVVVEPYRFDLFITDNNEIKKIKEYFNNFSGNTVLEEKDAENKLLSSIGSLLTNLPIGLVKSFCFNMGIYSAKEGDKDDEQKEKDYVKLVKNLSEESVSEFFNKWKDTDVNKRISLSESSKKVLVEYCTNANTYKDIAKFENEDELLERLSEAPVELCVSEIKTENIFNIFGIIFVPGSCILSDLNTGEWVNKAYVKTIPDVLTRKIFLLENENYSMDHKGDIVDKTTGKIISSISIGDKKEEVNEKYLTGQRISTVQVPINKNQLAKVEDEDGVRVSPVIPDVNSAIKIPVATPLVPKRYPVYQGLTAGDMFRMKYDQLVLSERGVVDAGGESVEATVSDILEPTELDRETKIIALENLLGIKVDRINKKIERVKDYVPNKGSINPTVRPITLSMPLRDGKIGNIVPNESEIREILNNMGLDPAEEKANREKFLAVYRTEPDNLIYAWLYGAINGFHCCAKDRIRFTKTVAALGIKDISNGVDYEIMHQSEDEHGGKWTAMGIMRFASKTIICKDSRGKDKTIFDLYDRHLDTRNGSGYDNDVKIYPWALTHPAICYFLIDNKGNYVLQPGTNKPMLIPAWEEDSQVGSEASEETPTKLNTKLAVLKNPLGHKAPFNGFSLSHYRVVNAFIDKEKYAEQFTETGRLIPSLGWDDISDTSIITPDINRAIMIAADNVYERHSSNREAMGQCKTITDENGNNKFSDELNMSINGKTVEFIVESYSHSTERSKRSMKGREEPDIFNYPMDGFVVKMRHLKLGNKGLKGRQKSSSFFNKSVINRLYKLVIEPLCEKDVSLSQFCPKNPKNKEEKKAAVKKFYDNIFRSAGFTKNKKVMVPGTDSLMNVNLTNDDTDISAKAFFPTLGHALAAVSMSIGVLNLVNQIRIEKKGEGKEAFEITGPKEKEVTQQEQNLINLINTMDNYRGQDFTDISFITSLYGTWIASPTTGDKGIVFSKISPNIVNSLDGSEMKDVANLFSGKTQEFIPGLSAIICTKSGDCYMVDENGKRIPSPIVNRDGLDVAVSDYSMKYGGITRLPRSNILYDGQNIKEFLDMVTSPENKNKYSLIDMTRRMKSSGFEDVSGYPIVTLETERKVKVKTKENKYEEVIYKGKNLMLFLHKQGNLGYIANGVDLDNRVTVLNILQEVKNSEDTRENITEKIEEVRDYSNNSALFNILESGTNPILASRLAYILSNPETIKWLRDSKNSQWKDTLLASLGFDKLNNNNFYYEDADLFPVEGNFKKQTKEIVNEFYKYTKSKDIQDVFIKSGLADDFYHLFHTYNIKNGYETHKIINALRFSTYTWLVYIINRFKGKGQLSEDVVNKINFLINNIFSSMELESHGERLSLGNMGKNIKDQEIYKKRLESTLNKWVEIDVRIEDVNKDIMALNITNKLNYDDIKSRFFIDKDTPRELGVIWTPIVAAKLYGVLLMASNKQNIFKFSSILINNHTESLDAIGNLYKTLAGTGKVLKEDLEDRSLKFVLDYTGFNDRNRYQLRPAQIYGSTKAFGVKIEQIPGAYAVLNALKNHMAKTKDEQTQKVLSIVEESENVSVAASFNSLSRFAISALNNTPLNSLLNEVPVTPKESIDIEKVKEKHTVKELSPVSPEKLPEGTSADFISTFGVMPMSSIPTDPKNRVKYLWDLLLKISSFSKTPQANEVNVIKNALKFYITSDYNKSLFLDAINPNVPKIGIDKDDMLKQMTPDLLIEVIENLKDIGNSVMSDDVNFAKQINDFSKEIEESLIEIEVEPEKEKVKKQKPEEVEEVKPGEIEPETKVEEPIKPELEIKPEEPVKVTEPVIPTEPKPEVKATEPTISTPVTVTPTPTQPVAPKPITPAPVPTPKPTEEEDEDDDEDIEHLMKITR